MSNINVLVACEESQAVCKAFRDLGFNAFSCDIQECSGGHPEWHIQGDVLKILNPQIEYANDRVYEVISFRTMDGKRYNLFDKWDLIIAHPPCTYFSTAGANWLFRGGVLDEERYRKGLEMRDLFMHIYSSDVPYLCIENVRAMKIWKLPEHTQEIQPYQFGHKYRKATRLWLRNLPKLIPTKIVEPEAKWISCGNKNRELQNRAVCKSYDNKRSKTFEGIAKAMAEQWGKYVWYQKYGGIK